MTHKARQLDAVSLRRARDVLLSGAERLTDFVDDEVVAGALLAAAIDFTQDRWGVEFCQVKFADTANEILGQMIANGYTGHEGQ